MSWCLDSNSRPRESPPTNNYLGTSARARAHSSPVVWSNILSIQCINVATIVCPRNVYQRSLIKLELTFLNNFISSYNLNMYDI